MKYLTFHLDREEYGLEILKVQEIIGMLPVTRVPRTPGFVQGVINLRGKIIPVIDLRAKLGLESLEPTAESCTIVVQADGVEVGLIVDKVSEVAEMAEVDAVPGFGPDVETEYLIGIGKRDERITLLLDIERVLSTQDVIDLKEIREDAWSASRT